MENTLKISKLEAAKRQIETAIMLYFQNMDSVSIHTLTCASHGILKDMVRKTDITSLILDEMKNNIKKERQNEFIKMLSRPTNYFKHLFAPPINKDLEFYEHETDLWLLDGCLMYEKLTGIKTRLMKIFETWFKIENGDVLVEEYRSLALMERKKYKSRADFYEKMLTVIKT